jgi:hypothetical protein
VYRNGVLVATVPNNGQYDDSTGDTGRAQYTDRVCETGTQTCSNDVTVSFQRSGTTEPRLYQKLTRKPESHPTSNPRFSHCYFQWSLYRVPTGVDVTNEIADRWLGGLQLGDNEIPSSHYL